MVLIPRIADVQCSRLTFQPGDRLVVKSKHRLDAASIKKLLNSVRRWSGPDVELIYICTLDYEIEVEKFQPLGMI